MLKSTHRPRAPSPPPPSLPPGWTEHTAPAGHKYYYNAATKVSTYTRPSAEAQLEPAQTVTQAADYISFDASSGDAAAQQWDAFQANTTGSLSTGGRRNHHHESKRPRLEDRPKHKYDVPGAEPWILVQTRLGRRFVHNTQTGESLWRFPEPVMEAVIKWDVQRLTEKAPETTHTPDSREPAVEDEEVADAEAAGDSTGPQVVPAKEVESEAREDEELASDEEYEEVEVTDEEQDGDTLSKPLNDEDDGDEMDEAPDDQPLEFNEEDIAWQLQQMGEDYGLDQGEFGMDEAGEWEEGAEGLQLTEEDSKALFTELLDDHNVNPYRTWEQIVESGRIIEDDRYVALPNMRSRKEAFSDWSRDKIQRLKEQRAREEKRDPKIPYLVFLQQHATPKLYWPEFKRKFRKEAELRDQKLPDKDKEKLYREHIKRLQLPEGTRKSDLSAVLKAQPLAVLNRSTSIDALPATVLGDLRYISLPADTSGSLIEAFITTLPAAPVEGQAEEDNAAMLAKRRDRERRERALAERERRVEEEKQRQRRDLEHGRGMLREEQLELERAMQVDDRGLRSQLQS